MMYFIFKNNQNTLFCVYGGSIEVSHSFIDHSGSFSTSTAVSTSNNNSFTNAITYQLQFFDDLHCNADIPLIQRSLEETLRDEEEVRDIMSEYDTDNDGKLSFDEFKILIYQTIEEMKNE